MRRRLKLQAVCLVILFNLLLPGNGMGHGLKNFPVMIKKMNESLRPQDIWGEELKEQDLYAKSALLLDGESRRVLYQKNGYEKLPMASTTKIMTCLLALEMAQENTVVEFTKNAASMPKVKLGASAGKQFYMEDMLYSLMLESHNDTAVAIAEAVGGSVEHFADLMNERAKKLGAFHTHFVTPNGLDHEEHYTTAYDLALIASEAVKNVKFLKIVNTRAHSFKDIEGKTVYQLQNKDAFLEMMDGAVGIKTGYTSKAGYCFVGAVKSGNKTLISVVLASGWPPAKTYKWKDTMKLMRYGLNHYEYRVLFDGISHYRNIKVVNGKEDEVETMICGKMSALVSDDDRVEYRYDLQEQIPAPVKYMQQVGTMELLINGEVLQSFPVCAGKNIAEIDFAYSMKEVLKKFLLLI